MLMQIKIGMIREPYLTDKETSVGKPISKDYSNFSPSIAAIYNINDNLNFMVNMLEDSELQAGKI